MVAGLDGRILLRAPPHHAIADAALGKVVVQPFAVKAPVGIDLYLVALDERGGKIDLLSIGRRHHRCPHQRRYPLQHLPALATDAGSQLFGKSKLSNTLVRNGRLHRFNTQSESQQSIPCKGLQGEGRART
jgi:hypothetical protein